MHSFNSRTHISASTFHILWSGSLMYFCNVDVYTGTIVVSVQYFCLCSTGGRCTWWLFWPWSSPSSSLRSTHTTSVSSGRSCARSSSAWWWGTAWSPRPTGSSSLGVSPRSSCRSDRRRSPCVDLTLYVQPLTRSFISVLPGFHPTSPGHVLHRCVGANLLRFQGSWTLLPRWGTLDLLCLPVQQSYFLKCVCGKTPSQTLKAAGVCPCRSAQLPGLQPPAVAPAAGADVLLVASVVGFHHGVQTQPALLRGTPAHLVCSVTQLEDFIFLNMNSGIYYLPKLLSCFVFFFRNFFFFFLGWWGLLIGTILWIHLSCESRKESDLFDLAR